MNEKTKKNLLIIGGIIVIILLLKSCDVNPLSVAGGGGGSWSSSSGGGGDTCPVCPICSPPPTQTPTPERTCSAVSGVCTDSVGTYRNGCSDNSATNYICDTGLNRCSPTTTSCTGALMQGACYYDTAYNLARCVY